MTVVTGTGLNWMLAIVAQNASHTTSNRPGKTKRRGFLVSLG